MVANLEKVGTAAAADIDRISDIERRLLGCCLLASTFDGDGLDIAAELLTPADFGVYAHGLVFDVCLELRSRNAPVDAVTVRERLAARSKLGELGDQPDVWLADTLVCEPTDGRARYYAGLVLEASTKRKLRHVAYEIVAKASDNSQPVADTLAECEQLLFSLADTGDTSRAITAGELARETLQRIDDRASRGGADGLRTGFDDLDVLLGGLKPGQLIIVGARPGVGKTSLALGIASNTIAARVPTYFASLEMPRSEIGDRLLATRSRVPMRRIQDGNLNGEQAELVTAAARLLEGEPLFLDDASDQTSARLASVVRRGIRRNGVQLVLVDYLQLVTPENPRDNRNQQVGLVARRMKLLARSCNVPVVLLCQLNREVEGRNGGKPRLSDLRESGEIEQHADGVILLHTQPDQAHDTAVWKTDVIVAKNRNGPTSEVVLEYVRPLTMFRNAAK